MARCGCPPDRRHCRRSWPLLARSPRRQFNQPESCPARLQRYQRRGSRALIRQRASTGRAVRQGDAFDRTPCPASSAADARRRLRPLRALSPTTAWCPLRWRARRRFPQAVSDLSGQPWHPQLELIARAADQPSTARPGFMRLARPGRMEISSSQRRDSRKSTSASMNGGFFTVSVAERNAR